jgi:hypothetical protein
MRAKIIPARAQWRYAVAGKPRILTDHDKEFLTEVPRSLRIAYPGRKAAEDVARDFDVSVHTAKGWLHRNAFPLERKREFITKITRRLDYLSAKSKEFRKLIIDTMLDGVDPREPTNGRTVINRERR